MRKRTVLVTVLTATCVIAPVLLYAAMSRQSDLDRFLNRRASLLNQLRANAINLPNGYEHVIPLTDTVSFPLDDHITSVVRGGRDWFGTNLVSYDLMISNSDGESPRETLVELFEHLASGVEELGFTSPKSGGPDWLIENRRAAHSQYWLDANRNLIVTLTVVVDGDSNSAHITQYVHQHFE